MPNSSRMGWPYPNTLQDPWFDIFVEMVSAIDADSYAAREDRNLWLGGGGTVGFDTGELSWSEDLIIFNNETGFTQTIPAGSVTLEDGQLFYVEVVRRPTSNKILTSQVASTVPSATNAMAIAIRNGDAVFWRHGAKIANGESFDIFQGGGGSGGGSSEGDTYALAGTVLVPDGSSTSQEITLGRVTYPGSLIGLSVDLTESVNSGTIDVIVRLNGFDAITVTLDTGSPNSGRTVIPVGDAPVVPNDEITLFINPTAYDNVSGLDGGITANVTLTTGLTVDPTDIPEASTSQKGIAKVSVTPVDAADPIAVGDNDPRMTDARTPTGAAGGDLGGTYPNPTVNDGADNTAIHINVAGEISSIAEKTVPVVSDLLVIEDSAAGNVKKRVQLGNIPVSPSNPLILAKDADTDITGADSGILIAKGDDAGGVEEVELLASGVALGSVSAVATGTARVRASGEGGFAGGRAVAGAGQTTQIRSSATGSRAQGFAKGGADIHAEGHGSFAQGYADTAGRIRARYAGSFAFGWVGLGDSTTFVESYGYGGAAGGYASGVGSTIQSDNFGTFAWGGAESGGTVRAAARSSVAFGLARNTGANIYSAGYGSMVFGEADGQTGGTADLQATNPGALAFGQVIGNGAGATAEIIASQDGGVAGGAVTAVTGETSFIRSQNEGSFAHGFARRGGQITVNAAGPSPYGGFAQGAVDYGGTIQSLRRAARASGFASASGTGTSSADIIADQPGAIVHGHALAEGDNSTAIIQQRFNANLVPGFAGTVLGSARADGDNSTAELDAGWDGSTGDPLGGFLSGTARSYGAGGTASIRNNISGTIFADAYAYGSNTALAQSLSRGAFLSGHVYSSGGDATMQANGLGGAALGYVFAGTGTGGGRIEAGTGAFVHGSIYTGGTSETFIEATANGSFAQGYAGGNGSLIRATAYGAFSQGHAYSGGIIEATAAGSFASGRAVGPYDISATAYGSHAFGHAGAGDIVASGTNAFQFGEGTNSQADSLGVGTTMRLKGTTGAPGTPRDGDLWVDSTFQYMRSGGLSQRVAGLDLVQTFTKNQRSAVVSLTDAANVSIDAEDSNIFELFATSGVGATRQLDNPSNLAKGMSWQVWFHQDASGSRALTFDTQYDFGDEGVPDFSSQAANVSNIISCIAITNTQIFCTVLTGAA